MCVRECVSVRECACVRRVRARSPTGLGARDVFSLSEGAKSAHHHPGAPPPRELAVIPCAHGLYVTSWGVDLLLSAAHHACRAGGLDPCFLLLGDF